MIKVCYLHSYRDIHSARTASLIQALRCIPYISLFIARNKSRGVWRYIETFGAFLKVRIRENPDIYIVGFRGHEVYWLFRLLALNKIFIFDQMMSPYDSMVNERKYFSTDHLFAKLVFCLERMMLNSANSILTDTKLHKFYLSGLFGLDESKIFPIPIGTDEAVFFRPNDRISNKKFDGFFNVLFYGNMLPLHGVHVILEAAKILIDEPIIFTIIGGKNNKEVWKNFRLNGGLDHHHNVKYLEWIEFFELPRQIRACDLALGGPFGGTSQAKRVITTKAFQMLAIGKATVVGEIDEDYGFIDRYNCFIVEQNNSCKLADAILWAFHNANELDRIGANGRALFESRFSSVRLSQDLELMIKSLII